MNVLASGQADLALRFAGKGGLNKFAGISWELQAEVPRLPGAQCFLGCTIAGCVPAGDHVIVLGNVVTAEGTADLPLLYHGRVFGTNTAFEEAGR